MIVVDTSVWIGARRDAALARVLDSLLDADAVAMALPVRLELWAGTARKDRRTLDAARRLLLQQVFERLDQARMTGLVVGRVPQLDVAVAIQRDAVLRIGKVFRRQPEVE